MTPISNNASKEALTHTGLMLATVYAGWLMEGPPLKIAELAVAVTLAFLVLAIDAWGAYDAWRRRPATQRTPPPTLSSPRQDGSAPEGVDHPADRP